MNIYICIYLLIYKFINLIGVSSSEWIWEWPKGTFKVEFRGDGFNHFICPDFPAHSHWDFNSDENIILIDWERYGKFEVSFNLKLFTVI